MKTSSPSLGISRPPRPCNRPARRLCSGWIALALLTLIASQAVWAADSPTTEWTGSTDAVWGTAGNWVGGVPLTTTVALFDTTFTNQPTLGAAGSTLGIWLKTGVGQDVTINSVAAQTLTIGGTGTINGVANSGLVMSDTGNHNLTIGPNTSITLSSNQLFNNLESSASTLTISGGLNLNTKTLTIGANATSTGNVLISGNISGTTGAITINSGGAVTLSGTNSYTGLTTLTLGTLNLNSNNAISSTGGLTLTSGTIDNTSAGAVSISMGTLSLSTANITYGGTKDLTFSSSATNLVENSTITLNGTGNLNMGNLVNTKSGVPVLTVNGVGKTLTFGTFGLSKDANARIPVIAGTGNVTFTGGLTNGGGSTASGITYSGSGVLTLNGVNNYGGTTTINGGGTLVLKNTGSGLTQSLSGALAIGGGDVTLQSNNAGTGTLSSTFGSLATRTAGSAGNIVLTGASNGIFFTTAPTANNLIDKGMFFGGADYAAYDATTGLRAMTYASGSNPDANGLTVSSGGTDLNGTTSAGVAGTSSALTSNVLLTADITANTKSWNTLKILGSHTLTVNAGVQNQFTGILETGGQSTIAAGNSTSSLKANGTGAEYVIRVDGATDTLTINPIIAANGTNALTKSGAGKLTLSGINTYTGNTYINAGILNVNNNNALGTTGAVTLNGGTLQFGSSVTTMAAASYSIPTGATGIFDTQGNTVTLNGAVTGAGTGALQKIGSGSLQLKTGANAAPGGFLIQQGQLKLSGNPNGTANLNGPVTIGGGGGTASLYISTGATNVDWSSNYPSQAITIAAGSTDQIIFATSRYVGFSSAITLQNDLGISISNASPGFSGGITGTGSVTISGAKPFVDAAANKPTFNTTALNFTGLLTNTATDATGLVSISSVIGANVTGVIENGTCPMSLSGANTYTSPTSIQQGTLSAASLNYVTSGNWGTHVSSNLGAPTTVANGTIAIGSVANAGQLTYNGTGETTDRVINLAGTTGGATIDQSGASGLLKFTSDLTATGAGIKTLTLQGSTAGTGEIGGAIVDNSGTNKTSVTKAGTGTWTLSGTNTYTGVTTISGGGTLDLEGSNTGNGNIYFTQANSTTNTLKFSSQAAIGTGEISSNGTVGANINLQTVGSSPITLTNAIGVVKAWTNPGITNATTYGMSIAGTAALVLNGNISAYNTYGFLVNVNNTGGTTFGGTTFNPDTYGAATFTTTFAGTTPITMNSMFSKGSGTTISLTYAGSSAMSLNNSGNTYNGATTVENGTLVVGAVAPSGSNGALGNAATAVALGDATTISSNFSPSLLIGGAYTVARGITVGSATTATSGIYTIGGNTANTSAFTGSITLNQPLTIAQAASGILQFNTGTWTTNDKAITIGTSGNTGTVQLTNSLSTTAGITVNYGTLSLGASSVISATTPVTVSGGVLDTTVTNYTDSVSAFNMSSGSLNGGGTITAATYGLTGGTVNAQLGAGAITVNTGTVTLGSVGRLNSASTLSIQGGQLTIAGSESVASYQQTGGTLAGTGFTLTSAAAYDMQAGTVSANLGGSVALNKTGTGTLTISGVNAYSGGTRIKNGSVILGGGNDRLLATGSVILGDTSTSGKLVLGDGTARNQTLAGLTTTGTGGNVVGGAASASTLTLNIASTNTFGGTLGGAGTNENNLALIKIGEGTLTLTGDNTYSGVTTVSAGKVVITSNTALGSTAGATTVAGGDTTAQLQLSGGITVTGEALTIGAKQLSNLNTAALSNLDGANTWTGAITMTTGGTGYTIESLAGSLALTGGISSSATGSRTLTLTGAGDGTVSTTAIANGSATVGLTKSGSGTWTLSGANTYNGTTSISAGKLAADAANALGGTTAISVTGGSLLIGANEVINNSAGVTLGGGTLAMNGAYTETLGALTLSATSSTLDFGSLTSQFKFSSFTPAGFTLNVAHWTASDSLFFTADQTSNLSKFSFGSGLTAAQQPVTGGFEIIAVPEPGTILAGVLLLGGLAFAERKRLRKLVRAA